MSSPVVSSPKIVASSFLVNFEVPTHETDLGELEQPPPPNSKPFKFGGIGSNFSSGKKLSMCDNALADVSSQHIPSSNVSP